MNIKDRKGMNGFTLVELLVSIGILAFILLGVVIGVVNFINNSKDNALMITENGIKEAARSYAYEGKFNGWQKVENVSEKHEYFCVTVGELINKGMLKKEKIDKEKYPLNLYIAVIRDKNTKTIEKEEFVNDNAMEIVRKVCTGNSKESEKYIPNIKQSNTYTDEININIDYNELKERVLSLDDEIKEVSCLYGESSSTLNSKGVFDHSLGRCNFTNLKSNTNYYSRVCIETNVVSSACTNTDVYVTKDLVKPLINISYVVNIKYNNQNIKGESYHYFKSTINGQVNSDVYECNNNFECNNNVTREIKGNTWYRTLSSDVNVSIIDASGKITARIMDKSNNYNEDAKEYSVNKVTFLKDVADRIGEQTNNIEKRCLSAKGSSCKVISPSIERLGYESLGWNTDRNSKVSNWNIGVEKEISGDEIYYPILIKSPIYVYYHVNGGTLTGNAGGYNWTTDNNGIIYRNDVSKFYSVLSNAEANSSGFVNYNNISYINITKAGYIAKNGAEWNTKSDGSGTSFNQDTVYTYDDLSNYVVADGNDYRLDLYVIWTPRTYTINYYLGNGNGGSKIGSSTCIYKSNCTLKNWSTFGKTFTGSSNKWSFAGWSNSSSGTNRDYSNGQSFMYDKTNDLNLYAVGHRTFNFYSGNAPTSLLDSEVQYWNPYSNDGSHSTSITIPSPIGISGWSFVGYRASNDASSIVTFNNTGVFNPSVINLTNLEFRSIYKRDLIISFNSNGGSSSMNSLSATQYYNSGYAFGGINSGSNKTTPSFTLPSNQFTPPTNMKFSKWAVGSTLGAQYSAGVSYSGFSPGVGDSSNQTMYAIWEIADNVKPTCQIKAENVDGSVYLTVSGSDNIALASKPFVWEGDASYSSVLTKTVAPSSTKTYKANVIDAVGNTNSCSIEISKTTVSKYKKTSKTCKAYYVCKADLVCSTGSKCSGNSNTKGKCECYTSQSASIKCSDGYNYYSPKNQCYKQGSWSNNGTVNMAGQATKLTDDQCNRSYVQSVGALDTERYSSCVAIDGNATSTWDTYWYCQCTKQKRTIYWQDISYSCPSSSDLKSGTTCYTYNSANSCSDGGYKAKSIDGNYYCFQDDRTSCSSPYSKHYFDYAEFGTSSNEEVTSCTESTFTCNETNKNKTYVSCSASEYSCSSGTKINNNYCAK